MVPSRVEISGCYPQTQLYTRKEGSPQTHRCEVLEMNNNVIAKQAMLVVAQSKAWVCGRCLAGIVGPNPAEGIDVCLLRVLRVDR